MVNNRLIELNKSTWIELLFFDTGIGKCNGTQFSTNIETFILYRDRKMRLNDHVACVKVHFTHTLLKKYTFTQAVPAFYRISRSLYRKITIRYAGFYLILLVYYFALFSRYFLNAITEYFL